MPCDNKPCTREGQFTNTKDSRQFCSRECAKDFYKTSKVSVDMSGANQDGMVSMSQNHPVFARMSAKVKQTFLSFGRENSGQIGEARQEEYVGQSLMKICTKRDKNGNVARFNMEDAISMQIFESFLKQIKETQFILSGRLSLAFSEVNTLLNIETRPVSIAVYDENMPAYLQKKKEENVDLIPLVTDKNYTFTLYNYIRGFVPSQVNGAHRPDMFDHMLTSTSESDMVKHRLILYTAPDRSMQFVLYAFGKGQKVDWEKHPNLQMIRMAPNSDVRVSIKSGDKIETYSGRDVQEVIIPANVEHLLEGSGANFLSIYFPAEDEPVFKINEIPVYKEWGQTRLPLPPS